MFKNNFAIFLAASALSVPMFAQAGDHSHGSAATAWDYVVEIEKATASHATTQGSEFFKTLAKGQTPRATVITCSDSRVHTTALDNTPEGDMFMIRNIGNQLETAHGSVEYGVNHLGSSLLLVIGHSSCGAIKAAGGDYSSLEAPIKKELDTIKISKGTPNIDGVKTNVNNQISTALKEWSEKVKKGELLVIGAVYDFSDDMKRGSGKLNIINVNGETNPVKISQMIPSGTATELAKLDSLPADFDIEKLDSMPATAAGSKHSH